MKYEVMHYDGDRTTHATMEEAEQAARRGLRDWTEEGDRVCKTEAPGYTAYQVDGPYGPGALSRVYPRA